jgi:hypothetical protein
VLVNLLFWIIITLIIFPYGITISIFLKVNDRATPFFLSCIIGILPIMMLTTIWGFFYRINNEILFLLILLSFIQYYTSWNLVLDKIRNVKSWWLKLNTVWQISIVAFVLITAFQASMPTNIPDDGFYYLQTIKWANKVGIPLGVARFGFQYGQFSSWHILQAAFNLSYFFGNHFNNINGWLTIMITLWALHDLSSTKNSARLFNVFIVFVVASLQFFNTAPSPDLPVILLSLMVFKLFLFEEATMPNFSIIVVLSLMAITIKMSAFYLILFVLFFGYKILFKDKKLIVLTVIIFATIVSKNLATTGILIFPFNFYTPEWVNWKVDENILKEGKIIIKNSPLISNYSEFLTDFSVAQKINSWFNHKGYRGLINKLWLFGILLLGIVSIIDKSRVSFMVFVIAVVHFAILWLFAPNYRFALAIILLIYYLIFYFLIGYLLKNHTASLMPVGLILSIVWLTPLIHPVQKLSSNQIIASSYPLMPQYLLVSAKPFISNSYEKKNFNGEEVYIPPGYHYAWDGPLPCVMRNHYEKYAKPE